MAIQMYDKQGNSEIVDNRKVQQYLGNGWTYSRPAKVEKPKPTKVKKVQSTTKEETAKVTKVLEAEATAEVIKQTNKED